MPRTASTEKRAEWRRRMERFSRSHLTVTDFCRRESVTIAAFYYWRQQHAQSPDSEFGAASKQVTPSRHRVTSERFIPVEVLSSSRTVADGESLPANSSSRCSSTMEVILPNGARLHVPTADAVTLQRLLSAIATVQCGAAGVGPC